MCFGTEAQRAYNQTITGVMTQEEKEELRNFFTYCNKSCSLDIFKEDVCLFNEKDIFTGSDKDVSKKILNLIMTYQNLFLDYFSFTNFLKPLIKKLAIKLFDYGEITADECLYYKNITLR